LYNVRWAGSSVGGPEGDLRWGLDSGDTALTGNPVNMQTYLDAWSNYEQNNSNTMIIYSTGPVDGGGNVGESGYQRYLKHEYIRDWVRDSNNRILFDYADILTHDNAGEASTVTWDGHTYPYIHPDNVGNYDGGDGGCHISEQGCIRLAKAMWVLLAKKAGWDGVGGGVSHSLNVIISGNGSVTKTPDKPSYYLREQVSLQAVASPENIFTHWSGSSSGTTNPLSITMDSDKSVTANFRPSTIDMNSGQVGYWKLDETSGTIAQDSSGNSNTGTLVNGPTWTTGRVDGGLSFDGVDDAVEVSTSAINISGGTIALWAYVEDFGTATRYFFSHATQPWSNRIQLYTGDAEGFLALGLGDNHSRRTGIENLATHRWYNIALSWDGTNYVVYVDGSTRATGTYYGLSALAGYADIGGNGNRSDRTESFRGVIDEVRIYNRVLTSDEVLEVYNTEGGTTNQAPVLSAIGDKSVSENQTLTFTIAATDADGDTITYSVENPPSGATFADQTFNWTPGYDQTGTYQVTFTASDSRAHDSETVTIITVGNTNRAPVLAAIGDRSVNENVALSFTVSATDADGDTISYSIAALPSGATFANQTFAWTPTHSQMGSHQVTFTASDGQLEDSETITIVVSVDVLAPSVTNCLPTDGLIQVPLNSVIVLHVEDTGEGVDANSVQIHVDGHMVYAYDAADPTDFSSSYGRCRRTGTKADYAFVYQSQETFDFGQTITVAVNANDIAGNRMETYSYSFTTEMRSFGENERV
ncbi:MAG: LamG domain-containing protein, partial [Planctomycetota bacterium]